MNDLRQYIVDVPDFPQPGVVFRDLTPLWADAEAFAAAVDALATPYDHHPPQAVAGIEARGFVLAAALARHWRAGLLPIRKPGKLPRATIAEDYRLEYGSGRLEMTADEALRGRRVLLVDDVLATGGTLSAARRLLERAGCVLDSIAVLVELEALGGRARLGGGAAVHAVLSL